MVKKIMTVALVTSNIEKAIEFYTEKLGLKVKTKMDVFADFEMEGTHIALLAEGLAKDLAGDSLSPNFGKSRPAILAWDAVEDVDALYEELKAKGVEFFVTPKTMPWGQRVAYFKDYDGNVWEISQFNAS